jgi:hypothetical protein
VSWTTNCDRTCQNYENPGVIAKFAFRDETSPTTRTRSTQKKSTTTAMFWIRNAARIISTPLKKKVVTAPAGSAVATTRGLAHLQEQMKYRVRQTTTVGLCTECTCLLSTNCIHRCSLCLAASTVVPTIFYSSYQYYIGKSRGRSFHARTG